MFRLKQYKSQEKDIQYEKIYSLIPLNIFQTWYTLDLPENMRRNIDLLKQTNPEFKHYLYDDEMCRNFIKENFNNDTLWAFDKLRPGAYKADLWRYCVLYIHGGIYLDIKFRSVNNFRLIELTDKEYWVKDRKRDINGIYQALMITFPKNEILQKAIESIIVNCKNNFYSLNPLAVSGPSLLGKYFNEKEFQKFPLENIGDIIIKNNISILHHYSQYRKEQNDKQKTPHYDFMWNMLDIYNYPTLNSIKKIDITYNLNLNVDNRETTFYSFLPIVIKKEDQIIIFIEHVVNNKVKSQYFTITQSTIDFDLNNQSENKLLQYNFNKNITYNLRIFYTNNNLYYLCNHIYQQDFLYISSHKLDKDNTFIYNPINEDHYRKSKNQKELQFFLFQNKLSIINGWYPLQIGNIDYDNRNLKVNHIKYDTPSFFYNITHSSNGVTIKDEIWFILGEEKSKNNRILSKHLFAVFDLDMNFKKHSEFFSFENEIHETCKSFFVEKNQMFIAYTVFYNKCYIAKYKISHILEALKWFE
tara:strand:+ start:18190 stop:19776 length:1587 start_codon:yes stop_codon:yes gene_type:complete